jgi:hypothetical protein
MSPWTHELLLPLQIDTLGRVKTLAMWPRWHHGMRMPWMPEGAVPSCEEKRRGEERSGEEPRPSVQLRP